MYFMYWGVFFLLFLSLIKIPVSLEMKTHIRILVEMVQFYDVSITAKSFQFSCSAFVAVHEEAPGQKDENIQ